jgi:hypothetical protein
MMLHELLAVGGFDPPSQSLFIDSIHRRMHVQQAATQRRIL